MVRGPFTGLKLHPSVCRPPVSFLLLARGILQLRPMICGIWRRIGLEVFHSIILTLHTDFFFCSRLRPLAQILRPQIDIVGFRQFLHEAYMLSGRTFYRESHWPHARADLNI